MNQEKSQQTEFGSLYSLFILFFITLMAVLTIFPSTKLMAQGNLLIMPRRVVFEGTKKSQDLVLANTGQDTAKYLISLVHMRMKDDGAFEQITKPDSGQYFADNYIRFYPRTVRLAPNESQTVKMNLTRTEKLAPGEYRSHIDFRAVPRERPLGEDETKTNDTNVLSATLVPSFGITIPVIVRIGESVSKVTLSNTSFEMVSDTLPRLKMTFNRSGNISVYGDLAIEYVSPQGKITRVGIARGIAVYTPNVLRRFQINLDKIAGINYHSGKLHILYTPQIDVKSPKVLSETELVLH